MAIAYRGTAPAAATSTMFVDARGEPDAAKSRDSGLAVGVPGTVAGLALGAFGPAPRPDRGQVCVGSVTGGGTHAVVVQSMTNTDTADIVGTTKQGADLWRAGSELVRVTVNTAEAAAAVPRIVERLSMMGIEVPVIGDFHYNGHQLLTNEPACEQALAKYRINPGNVGFGRQRDTPFAQLIAFQIKYGKPVRIALHCADPDPTLGTTAPCEQPLPPAP